MAEIYEDWLSSKMTRDEFNKLTDEEKKERKRLKQIIRTRKYRENNPEKVKEYKRKHHQNNKETENERSRKYRENNKEKIKEQTAKYREEHREERNEYNRQYKLTPAGKKSNTLADWKHHNLQETDEELDIIYDMWLHQEFCYSCDVKLTRDGVCSTQAVLDHDHITHRFRQICCRACNNHDSWMKYWC